MPYRLLTVDTPALHLDTPIAPLESRKPKPTYCSSCLQDAHVTMYALHHGHLPAESVDVVAYLRNVRQRTAAQRRPSVAVNSSCTAETIEDNSGKGVDLDSQTPSKGIGADAKGLSNGQKGNTGSQSDSEDSSDSTDKSSDGSESESRSMSKDRCQSNDSDQSQAKSERSSESESNSESESGSDDEAAAAKRQGSAQHPQQAAFERLDAIFSTASKADSLKGTVGQASPSRAS